MSRRTVWDVFSPVYDLAETVYNRDVYKTTGERAAEYIGPGDRVLECACGTGEISIWLAGKCRHLTATDMSDGMLRRAGRKLRNCYNVKLARADIMHIKCPDGSFDKVVAGNVIHLLDDPEGAVNELRRVCRRGGKIIIPTYINDSKTSSRIAVKLLGKLGVKFHREFDIDSYRKFFSEIGYPDAEFTVVDGRMPCALAVITKK